MPCGQKTKSINRSNIVTNSTKTLKIVLIKKNLKNIMDSSLPRENAHKPTCGLKASQALTSSDGLPLGPIDAGLSKNLAYKLLYDSAIPLLGIYAKELTGGMQRDICTPVLIAALFTIAER